MVYIENYVRRYLFHKQVNHINFSQASYSQYILTIYNDNIALINMIYNNRGYDW